MMHKRNGNRGRAIFIMLLSVLLMVACTPQAEAPREHLKLSYRGQDICVGAEIEPLLAMLGDDYTVAEADSCAGIGRDMVYTYPSLRLYVFAPENGVARLTSAAYTDDGADIDGVRIGSLATDVISAMGEPDEKSEVRLLFCDATATLTFTLREGCVSAIVLAENE